jgi:hypothetical protein
MPILHVLNDFGQWWDRPFLAEVDLGRFSLTRSTRPPNGSGTIPPQERTLLRRAVNDCWPDENNAYRNPTLEGAIRRPEELQQDPATNQKRQAVIARFRDRRR